MFNKDFYPTPTTLIDKMLLGVDIEDKVVLEPSAGKGDIIEVLKIKGAKQVLFCETNQNLALMAGIFGKFLTDDFLTVTSDMISHVDFIVMNPPFSADEMHIYHALEIAPGGCQIIALCNYNTYEYPRGRQARILKKMIDEKGTIERIENAFSDAERKTNVDIGLIRIHIPKMEGEDEFDGYFDLSEEYEQQEDGIMQFNEVRNIVNRYVGAIKMFDDVMGSNKAINDLIGPINRELNMEFGIRQTNGRYSHDISRDQFKKELQKSAWKSVFGKLDMRRFVTKSVLDNLNKFVEQQTHVPFTMNNIYKMLEMIVGTHGGRMEKVIVEAFDSITSYYHGNRQSVEGWKTNDQWMVNRKFILPSIFEDTWSFRPNNLSMSHHKFESNQIEDLTKALCWMTGRKFEEIGSFYQFIQAGKFDFNKWQEYGFLKFKGFKKGSGHFEFLDEAVWIRFNQAACKAKGWQLPESTTHNYRRKGAGVDVI